MRLDPLPTSTDRMLIAEDISRRTEEDLSFWSSASPTRLVLENRFVSRLRMLSDLTYPYEACGLLVGRRVQDVIRVCQVLQTPNLSEDGNRDRYHLDPEAFLVAEKNARKVGLQIVGIWHSHPNHPADPSTRDLESAWHGYSYVIVSVDALGDTVLRSWRLRGGRLVVEPIEIAADRSA